MHKTEFPDPPHDWCFWEVENFDGLALHLKEYSQWSRWHIFEDFFVYDVRDYEYKKLWGFIPIFRFRVESTVIWTKLESDDAKEIRRTALRLLYSLEKREKRTNHLIGKYPPKKLSDWENA